MIYILYHFPCQDGFGAAYAAWKKFKDNAKYIPVNYGKKMPDMPNASEVYIIDFSFSKEVLLDLKNKVGKVVVLDHHKTAKEDLAGLDFATFDMNKSGAGLSWDYFNPGIARPELIDYIEDRDLWKFKLENTELISVALSSYPFDFEVWDKLTVAQLLEEGMILKRYQKVLIEDMCRNCQTVNIAGFDVPTVNSPILVSDAAEALAEKFLPQGARFVALYFDTKDGRRKWSLRSKDSHEDVGAIASKFGGGGHRNASGFIEDFPGQKVIITPKTK